MNSLNKLDHNTEILEEFTIKYKDSHSSETTNIYEYIIKHLNDETVLNNFIKQYHENFSIPKNKSDSFSAVYHRFYRIINKLESNNYIKSYKKDGNLIFVQPTVFLFDLIKQVQNSNYTKPESEKSIYEYPNRTKPERIEAIKIADKDLYLTDQEKFKIKDKFQDYIDEINDSKIVLERILKENESGEKYLFLDYETRFNSKKRKARYLSNYEKAIDKSLKDYKKAVHLTLTTDPKRFNSKWKANRHFQKAFNRFMSYLTKYLGERPNYIAVYEFTNKGFLHAHILIFGKLWLMKKDQITREWERCGQGSINYIYSLKNNRSKKWEYSRSKPDEKDEGDGAGEYLKKYLIKSAFELKSQVKYWLYNKRFFTRSKKFMVDLIKNIPVGKYKYLGTWLLWNIPNYIFNHKNNRKLNSKLGSDFTESSSKSGYYADTV